MKKLLLVGAGIFAITFLPAQQEIRNPDGSYYKQCARMAISEPLWKIAKEHPLKRYAKPKLTGDALAHEKSSPSSFEKYNPDASTIDPVIQTTDGQMEAQSTIVSVQGASGQGGYPLDPNGMIGSNYYVQTVNSTYMIFNKTGTTKLAETDLGNLFGAFTCDDGDPVTMYDRFADRWVITEFQENDAACNGSGNLDTLMFAVSITNDPTGSYYLYYFCPDNSETADYPKYSIWADGYYETCNCQNDKVTVYDRTKMLAGNKAAGFIVMPFNSNPWNTGGQGGFFCPMTMYADGTLPPYGTPNYLLYFNDDNWGGSFKDQILIDKIAVNWSTKKGTISSYQTLTPAAFNSYFTGGSRADIDAVGSANYYDASDGFFSYRIPYMRWASYNAAVMANVVNVSASGQQAEIRWYEIRQDTTSKLWSIYQQGTYAPNATNRWNPAIAMDQNGSIALSYSVSDKTSVYPGIRYTGRKSCDALGTMTLAEGTAVAGNIVANTAQGSGHRWGDYSHMSVDPIDGITFWSTNQYALSSVPGTHLTTRVFSFQIPKCVTTGAADVTSIEAELSAYESGNQVNIKGIKLPSNDNVVVELYDIDGKRITGKTMNTFSGTLETSFPIYSLAKGVYFVRLGNDNFMRVVKIEIN